MNLLEELGLVVAIVLVGAGSFFQFKALNATILLQREEFSERVKNLELAVDRHDALILSILSVRGSK